MRIAKQYSTRRRTSQWVAVLSITPSEKEKGITLIELLIAISLSSIIASAIGLIFEAAMEAWRFGEEMSSIEAVLPPLVNRISDGDYTHPGLVDALTITHADPGRLDFVPLILDYFEPDAFRNEDQKFPLSQPFLVGSPAPKGQVKLDEDKQFRDVPTVFLQGAALEPPEEKDCVQFVEDIPNDAKVRVIYRPDHAQASETIMSIAWNKNAGTVTEDYLGEKDVLSTNSFGTVITDLSFQFFNNANDEIISREENRWLTEEESAATTAIRISASARKGDTEKSVVQFINMRNLGWATSGVVIAEGSELTLPNSSSIRTFTIQNISGVTQGSQVKLEVESNYGQTWAVQIVFGLAEGKPIVLSYAIQYPEGVTVLEKTVFQPIAKGIDLMSLDSEGRYDYDKDDGVENEILFEDEPITLRVKSMELGGASIYVRP